MPLLPILAIGLLIIVVRAEEPGKTVRNLAVLGVIGLFLFFTYQILKGVKIGGR